MNFTGKKVLASIIRLKTTILLIQLAISFSLFALFVKWRPNENSFLDSNKVLDIETNSGRERILLTKSKNNKDILQKSHRGSRNCLCNNTKEELPMIYVITPTYKRLNQVPELTRLSNTLKNVPSIHWIVVEEGKKILPEIGNLLSTSGINFTYFSADPYINVSSRLRGIHQRNKAITWLRENIDLSKDGVVYFADDDNAYSLKLFDEMRYTDKISVWPVGLVSERKYQTPIVQNGKVVKFDSWNAEHRKFPIDMAGFALNTKLFRDNPQLYFLKTVLPGFQETSFLEICCQLDDLEPKADGCTKVLVWHTRTVSPVIKYASYNDSETPPII